MNDDIQLSLFSDEEMTPTIPEKQYDHTRLFERLVQSDTRRQSTHRRRTAVCNKCADGMDSKTSIKEVNDYPLPSELFIKSLAVISIRLTFASKAYRYETT